MITQNLSIPVGDGNTVSGSLVIPEGRSAEPDMIIILAHGAANDMNHPLLRFVADGLARAGYLALRFNFQYSEQGKRSPDPQKKLVQTWTSVCRFATDDLQFGIRRIVAAGKSMGGRVASQMAADGILPAERLIFLGYPLHAPGKTEKLRDDHLYAITSPMLFFSGTRDTFCRLDLLTPVLAKLKSAWELEVIEGGNHSFDVPKDAGVSQDDVYRQVLSKIVSWLGQSGS